MAKIAYLPRVRSAGSFSSLASQDIHRTENSGFRTEIAITLLFENTKIGHFEQFFLVYRGMIQCCTTQLLWLSSGSRRCIASWGLECLQLFVKNQVLEKCVFQIFWEISKYIEILKCFIKRKRCVEASRVTPAHYPTPTHRSCHEIENFGVE